jgi:hypothetical protein
LQWSQGSLQRFALSSCHRFAERLYSPHGLAFHLRVYAPLGYSVSA